MKKTILLLALLSTSTLAADWTPYLKGMQDSCKYEDNIVKIILKEKAIPKELKGDIIKHSLKDNGTGNDGVITLKNATAFGYPLKKISFSGYPVSYLQLQFANANGSKLLPKFHLVIGNKTLTAGTKSTKAILSEYRYNEHTDKEELVSLTQIPHPRSDIEFESYVNKGYELGIHYSIATATTQGWDNSSFEFGSYLAFDAKEQTLTCGHWYP